MTEFALSRAQAMAMVEIAEWAMPKHIVIPLLTPKEALRMAFPNRHALYSAGWRSGFTVNGMRAE